MLANVYKEVLLATLDLFGLQTVQCLPVFWLLLAFKLNVMPWHLFPSKLTLKGSQACFQLLVVHPPVPCYTGFRVYPVGQYMHVLIDRKSTRLNSSHVA